MSDILKNITEVFYGYPTDGASVLSRSKRSQEAAKYPIVSSRHCVNEPFYECWKKQNIIWNLEQ